MENRPRPPTSITDFKAKLPRVRFTREPKDEADIIATKALIEQYSDQDGFHCPRCELVIKDIEEAIKHLGEEINKTLEWLGNR